MAISRSGASPELSEGQWQRLERRFSRQRADEVATAVGAGANAAVDIAPARDEPAPATVPPGRRSWQPDAETLAQQALEYDSRGPKSILELQKFRRVSMIDIQNDTGAQGTATLWNLNPSINAWYVLSLRWDTSDVDDWYHLANAHPERQDLGLTADFPFGITIEDTQNVVLCDLWSKEASPSLAAAAQADTPYTMLCGEEVTLRRKTVGRKTKLELVTDFLRDNVWRGEKITVFVRQTLFKDSHLVTGEVLESQTAIESSVAAPRAARLEPGFEGSSLRPQELGLVFEATESLMPAGVWLPLRGIPGVFVSTLEPRMVAADILASHRQLVSTLDAVEGSALTYLVAFDLDAFDLGFSVGTDHPRVGWSERVEASQRDDSPGPDGIDSLAPVVTTGIVPPAVAHRTVATFTGGFKRSHGAFRSGELAGRNWGSHYGFIESGTLLSKLWPGISTILVLADGTVELKTWTEADDGRIETIDFARQNGVPLIDGDANSGESVPGALVSRWRLGNWSGSQDEKFRTLRAGLCLQRERDRRFLIYGYFSSATPSAMVRVFQAYGCEYALHLDMNALEHTYLAVYRLEGTELQVQHLIEEMHVLDHDDLPRFLGFADNRDFFYLLRREVQ